MQEVHYAVPTKPSWQPSKSAWQQPIVARPVGDTMTSNFDDVTIARSQSMRRNLEDRKIIPPPPRQYRTVTRGRQTTDFHRNNALSTIATSFGELEALKRLANERGPSDNSRTMTSNWKQNSMSTLRTNKQSLLLEKIKIILNDANLLLAEIYKNSKIPSCRFKIDFKYNKQFLTTGLPAASGKFHRHQTLDNFYRRETLDRRTTTFPAKRNETVSSSDDKNNLASRCFNSFDFDPQ